MPDHPTYRPVHKALHRSLTFCGVARRLFFLALLLGTATLNLFSPKLTHIDRQLGPAEGLHEDPRTHIAAIRG